MYSMEMDNDASWVVELSAIVTIVTEPGWAVVVGDASHKVQIIICIYTCICICICIFFASVIVLLYLRRSTTVLLYSDSTWVASAVEDNEHSRVVGDNLG